MSRILFQGSLHEALLNGAHKAPGPDWVPAENIERIEQVLIMQMHTDSLVSKF